MRQQGLNDYQDSRVGLSAGYQNSSCTFSYYSWPKVNIRRKLCIRSQAKWQLWPVIEADRHGNARVTREDTCFLQMVKKRNSHPVTWSVRFLKSWGQCTCKRAVLSPFPSLQTQFSWKGEGRWPRKTCTTAVRKREGKLKCRSYFN